METNDPNFWREQVFSNLGGALAFFGGLGGLVRALVFRVDWKETLRVVLVGSATAFGIGTLSPHVLKWLVGDLPENISGALGTLCSLAFIIGIVSVALVERFVVKKKEVSRDP